MAGAVSTVGSTVDVEEAQPRVIRIPAYSLNTVLSVALIVSVVLWRVWAVLQGTFQMQDWAYVGDAARLPFWDLVGKQYFGHVQPGLLAVVWLVTKAAPLDYGVAQAPVFLATAAGGILMWRFLRALFGDRPANLIPLAVFMLCPLTLPTALWWTTGLAIIPLQAFIVAAFFTVLRYVRAPSAGRLSLVAVVYGGALLYWQKALLMLPVIAMFVVLFLGEGRGRARIRKISLGLWRLWATLGALTAAYLVWYIRIAQWQFVYHPTRFELQRLTKTTIGSAIIPSYLGGPWSVPRAPIWNLELNQLPSGPRHLTWLVFGGIIGASLLFRRQAWRAWLLPLVYVGLCIELVAYGRLYSWVGTLIGLDARYIADSVPVFAIALALAFMVPLERRSDPGWARRVLVVQREVGQGEDEDHRAPNSSGLVTRPQLVTTQRLAVGVALVYIISAMVTNSDMAAVTNTASAKRWVSTVRAELPLGQGASIVDGYLPVDLIPGAWFPEDALASRALGAVTHGIHWNAPGENVLMFDSTGRLRRVEVGRISGAPPGPVAGCGYAVRPDSWVGVTVTPRLFYWNWGVSLSYFAAEDGNGIVTIDGDRQIVPFQRGLHTVTLVHSGSATWMTIESHTATVCVTDIWVGDLRPS